MDALTAAYFVAFVGGAGFAIVSWVLGALQGHGDAGGHDAGHAGGHDAAEGLHGDADADLELGPRGGGHLLGAGHGHALAHAPVHGLANGGVHAPVHGLAHGGAHAPGHGVGPHDASHHAVQHGHGHGHQGLAGKVFSPLLNLSALAALACIGGGAGYVARRAGLGALASLLVAAPSGLGAAYLVGGLVSWLRRETRFKEPLALGGTLATVLAPASTARLGEIMYVSDGARATLPARGTSDAVLQPGTEVVILDVKDGVARVGAATELLGIEPAPAAAARPKLPLGEKERAK